MVNVVDLVCILRAVGRASALPAHDAVAGLLDALTPLLRTSLDDVPLPFTERRVLSELASGRTSRIAVAEPFPPREREVLEWLLTGASQKEIAQQLGLSVHTVRQYVKNLYKRLGVSSRAELMATRASASVGLRQ
ncbi:MAG: helix-turn-helix transcriptional regulator [Labilithrix sp.]|nr:helix-turn-helix transcriptional regulator [Labilithrix sp.]